MATGKARILRFGVFEVDLRTGELRKNGLRTKLQDKPFQILALLLKRAGEAVTREELQEELWPTDTFVDFEHGVNTAVNKLRQALGDDADSPRFIETLPRRGYRFIGNIVEVPETSPGSPELPAAAISSPSGRFSRRGIALALAALLILATALAAKFDFFHLPLTARSAASRVESLAVLPLANMSGDPEQEYFADGMTEELITELSRIGSLRVISRTSVMPYKGERNKPLTQIARELHVVAVLEGSVLRSANRVRIVTHMIYAPTEQTLLSETYERDLGDVLKLQREVAESIAQQVRSKLTPEQQLRLQQASQVNPEAYEAYIKALSFDNDERQEIKKAQSYYEYALRKDPGFAPAYVGLASSYHDLGQFRWLSPQDAYPPAKLAALKALELDEKNCRAHYELAWLSWRYDWDWSTAEREFNHALELCPNSARTHWNHAYYLGWSGRGPEALAELAKTRELDPLLPEVLRAEALINYHLRNYKTMIDVGRRNVASEPNSWLAHYLLGVGYEGAGQILQALPEYQKAVELSERDQDPTAALAHASAAVGRREEAMKTLREWQHQSQVSYVSPYMIATVYAALGDKDRAFEFLEKAYQEKSSDLPYFLKADLRIDSLRSDPRFLDLLRRMGLSPQTTSSNTATSLPEALFWKLAQGRGFSVFGGKATILIALILNQGVPTHAQAAHVLCFCPADLLRFPCRGPGAA